MQDKLVKDKSNHFIVFTRNDQNILSVDTQTFQMLLESLLSNLKSSSPSPRIIPVNAQFLTQNRAPSSVYSLSRMPHIFTWNSASSTSRFSTNMKPSPGSPGRVYGSVHRFCLCGPAGFCDFPGVGSVSLTRSLCLSWEQNEWCYSLPVSSLPLPSCSITLCPVSDQQQFIILSESSILNISPRTQFLLERKRRRRGRG